MWLNQTDKNKTLGFDQAQLGQSGLKDTGTKLLADASVCVARQHVCIPNEVECN